MTSNQARSSSRGASGRLALSMAWALLALAAPAAQAWNDTGHMVAALMSYDALPPDQQTAAIAILRGHPRFVEDFQGRLPRSLVKASAAEQNRWYFAFAATWPDLARHFGNVRQPDQRAALVERYHHGRWHYINLPTYLQPGDAARLLPVLPSMTWSSNLPDADLNLVQALIKLSRQFCATRTTPAERAVALSWLLHLLADLHQPLHVTTLYAADVFPDGDRGGNDIAIAGGSNLHAMWDGALGSDRRWGRINSLARQYQRAPQRGSAVNLRDWAEESRRTAAQFVYSQLVRDAVFAAPTEGAVRVKLDPDYRDTMGRIAQVQIGLAGARTAAILAMLLPSQGGGACPGALAF